LAGDEFRQPTAGRGDVLPEGDTPHPGKIIDMAMLVAPGLSGAAVIDECGIAIGLVSMIPALQEDEEGAALEEGTFEREHLWSFMKRLVLASWGRLSEDLIGETSMG
jgi:hypothetical protein